MSNRYQALAASINEENDEKMEQTRMPGTTTIGDIIQKAMEDKHDSRGIHPKWRKSRGQGMCLSSHLKKGDACNQLTVCANAHDDDA